MRFLLIDRAEGLVPGQSLQGSVSIPRTLAYPAGRPDQGGPSPSLLLETMAQAGGWLIKVSQHFKVLAIMSVIKGFCIHKPPPPHGILRFEVETVPGSEMLRGITGRLRDQDGELVASVATILYVLTPVENDDWGMRAWAALSGSRELALKGVEKA